MNHIRCVSQEVQIMFYPKYPKRITISFKPEVYDFLRQESKQKQESMATLVREYTNYFFEKGKSIGLVETKDVSQSNHTLYL